MVIPLECCRLHEFNVTRLSSTALLNALKDIISGHAFWYDQTRHSRMLNDTLHRLAPLTVAPKIF